MLLELTPGRFLDRMIEPDTVKLVRHSSTIFT
jgi:hypothetical protein